MAELNKQDFMARIIQSAVENPELKKKLIADPKGVLESKLNFKLPKNFEVVVHQDAVNQINLVLPPEGGELTDFELEAVSGGVCWSYDSCPDHLECALDMSCNLGG